MLTTKDVCELSGIPPTTLNEWVSKGVVTPSVRGGRGPGNTHRFTLLQAVSLCVIGWHHNNKEAGLGIVLSGVKLVYEAFGNVTEAWLLERFAEGRTQCVYVHAERPVLDEPKPYDTPDVRAFYQACKTKLEGQEQ